MKTKICTKCGIEKELDCFSKDSRAKDGHRPQCKSCRSKYYHDNKEKTAKRSTEYYQNNKEKIAKRRAEYRKNNKEKIAKRRAEYYQNNKEKISKYRSRPEVKQRKAEYNAEYRSRPETREANRLRSDKWNRKARKNQPACVYKIVNTVNNKIYIGQTMRGELRWKEHLKDLRNGYTGRWNPNLQADFNKFGEDAFEWSIIKEYPKDRKLLENKEEQLIEQYEKEDKQLYNIYKTENK